VSGPALYVYIHISCVRGAGCMPVHVPYATGAHAHPVRIPAAGGGVGAVVGLGEGKNVSVAVVGARVVGAAVAAAPKQTRSRRPRGTVQITIFVHRGMCAARARLPEPSMPRYRHATRSTRGGGCSGYSVQYRLRLDPRPALERTQSSAPSTRRWSAVHACAVLTDTRTTEHTPGTSGMKGTLHSRNDKGKRREGATFTWAAVELKIHFPRGAGGVHSRDGDGRA
jgi:hypothetical protein